MKVNLPKKPKPAKWKVSDIIVFNDKPYMVAHSSAYGHFLVQLDDGTAWYTNSADTIEHLQRNVTNEKYIQAHLPSSEHELNVVEKCLSQIF